MMSGDDANPIFFNKKIKTGRPDLQDVQNPPPTPDNISFLLYRLPPPLPHPPQSRRHMCITTPFRNQSK